MFSKPQMQSNEKPDLKNISNQDIQNAKPLTQTSTSAIIQRAMLQTSSLTPGDILHLQRTIGNRAILQLLKAASQQRANKHPLHQVDPLIKEPPPIQKKNDQVPESQENTTGMPNTLKSGIETLSGRDISNVRVHHNSDKPSQVGALGYTQGTDIYIAPGQEQYLPHEAWHVVQQMQGSVRATSQIAGLPLNDDQALENEADMMGDKALLIQHDTSNTNSQTQVQMKSTIQLYKPVDMSFDYNEEIYQQRKMEENFYSQENRGLIKIAIPPNHELRKSVKCSSEGIFTIYGKSQKGLYHTEEYLVNQAMKLGVNPMTDPNDTTQPRIIYLYTEREPCNSFNADKDRKGRGLGSCEVDLTYQLHPNIEVAYSVSNSNFNFNILMDKESRRANAEKELEQYANNKYKEKTNSFMESGDEIAFLNHAYWNQHIGGYMYFFSDGLKKITLAMNQFNYRQKLEEIELLKQSTRNEIDEFASSFKASDSF